MYRSLASPGTQKGGVKIGVLLKRGEKRGVKQGGLKRGKLKEGGVGLYRYMDHWITGSLDHNRVTLPPACYIDSIIRMKYRNVFLFNETK